MAISRKPSASPWRASGVIWCSMLMTIGCTDAQRKTQQHRAHAHAQRRAHERIDGKQHRSRQHGRRPAPRHSRRCAATSGISMRIAAAAMANAPRMEPITEALKPRSWPSTGTTKVCTSQHDDSNQLTSIRRRNIGSRSKSQAVAAARRRRGDQRRQLARFRAPEPAGQRQHGHQQKGGAIAPEAAGSAPAWSISSPAANGPDELEIAGPMASQLNTCLSCGRMPAARPTWRCSAIDGRAGGAAGQQRRQAQHRKHRKSHCQRRPPPRPPAR